MWRRTCLSLRRLSTPQLTSCRTCRSSRRTAAKPQARNDVTQRQAQQGQHLERQASGQSHSPLAPQPPPDRLARRPPGNRRLPRNHRTAGLPGALPPEQE
jgi:hypothetical protein